MRQLKLELVCLNFEGRIYFSVKNIENFKTYKHCILMLLVSQIYNVIARNFYY